ncbi:MAG: hypothetical protein IT442_12120 [Phycisphaeraceae bacterium]|nr:hypothetical protein [Phycisphaeraceae bacterium]
MPVKMRNRTMRRLIVVLIASVVWSALSAGCGRSDAAEQARVHEAVAQATALLDRGLEGFVWPGHEGADDQTLAAYQAQQYQKAISLLDPVANQGSPVQRATVNGLLADLYAVTAGRTSAQASLVWAGLSTRAGALATYLDALLQAHTQAGQFSQDESALQSSLLTISRQVRDELEGIKAKAAEFQAKVDQNLQQARKLAAERDAHAAEAQKLSQEAFVDSTQQHFDTEAKAIEAQRAADAAANQIERLEAQRAVLDSELNILKSQIASLTKLADAVDAERTDSAQRDQQSAAKKDQALDQQSAALKELADQFHQVTADFDANVASLLDQADEQADRAVSLATAATRGGVNGAGREQAELALLSARLAQARATAQHVMVLGNFGRMLRLIAQNAKTLAAEQGQFLVETADRFTARQSELIIKAEADLTDAVTLAKELAQDPTSQTGKMAMSQHALLAECADRIAKAALAEPSQTLKDLAAPPAAPAPEAETPAAEETPVEEAPTEQAPATPEGTEPAPAEGESAAPAEPAPQEAPAEEAPQG